MPRGNPPVLPAISVPSVPHGSSEQTGDPETIRCFYVVRIGFWGGILKNTATGARTIWINKAITVVLFQLEGPESVDPAI